MTDDRDRRAAEEWLHARPQEPTTEALLESLAAFRAAARAEGAAEAISAAIDAATQTHGARERCLCEICQVVRRLRALAPAGFVAVDPADLEMVLPLAEGGPADYQQPSAWRDAHRRLRAAVVRKEG